MGAVRKARPRAKNVPAVASRTMVTSPTEPTLRRVARRRLRAPRRSTRSPASAGRGAPSRIRVLSWSSMLGMAVLLIGVLNERERLRQVRASLEELALDGALARAPLLRDLLRAEIGAAAEGRRRPPPGRKSRPRRGDAALHR